MSKIIEDTTGWISFHRKFYKSELAHTSPCTRELFLYLISHAQHTDFRKLKRGELFFRFEDFIESTSWYAGYRKISYSKPQVTKSLRRLCESNTIATTKATHGTLVKVLKYDIYQPLENHESNYENPTKEMRKKRSGTNINNNDNNDNNNSRGVKLPNPQVKELKEYLQEKVGTLDGTNKDNGRYCYLLINKMKKDYPQHDPVKSIKLFIDKGLQDKFHGPNITSFKYLYYNTKKIIGSISKSKSNYIAV